MLSFQRTVIALLFACLGFGFSELVRSEGLWGNFALGLHWRWIVSPEKAFLAYEAGRGTSDRKITNAADAFARPEWPGFRGPQRDGRQHGPRIALDWKTDPPNQIWKMKVGPGWSSFAVAGKWIFTQEQRGPLETVVCYEADSGLEVWKQQVESRFNDPLGGPGPRATPTLADGGLFVTFGTGIVMRLDPATGRIDWQQDMRKVADREPLAFGYSGSPLVVKSVAIVYAGGAGDKGILAFDKDNGKLQWSAATGDHSYASAQLSTLLGEPVVLMATNTGLNILDPATGAERLNYKWNYNGYRSVQPQVINGDSIVIASGMGGGTRCIRVSKTPDQLEAKELWTTRQLKPDFNDYVVYRGHAYGFDGDQFTSIDLETGRRDWKGSSYGKGQVLLLEDGGVLLVMGEQGEVVLLKADPSAPTELAKFQALEGKTWNHPVLVGDRLYVRNSQEAACYRLPLEKASK
jgi:outer membrane protein assembly factor BamB